MQRWQLLRIPTRQRQKKWSKGKGIPHGRTERRSERDFPEERTKDQLQKWKSGDISLGKATQLSQCNVGQCLQKMKFPPEVAAEFYTQCHPTWQCVMGARVQEGWAHPKSEGHIPRQGLVSLGPIPPNLHGGPNLMTICWQSYSLCQSRCNTGWRQRHSINIRWNNDWNFK